MLARLDGRAGGPEMKGGTAELIDRPARRMGRDVELE